MHVSYMSRMTIPVFVGLAMLAMIAGCTPSSSPDADGDADEEIECPQYTDICHWTQGECRGDDLYTCRVKLDEYGCYAGDYMAKSRNCALAGLVCRQTWYSGITYASCTEPDTADGDQTDAAELEEKTGEDAETDMDTPTEQEETGVGESDSEADQEAAEPGVITMEELPWKGVAVAACQSGGNSFTSSSAVWSDDKTLTYFGGKQFWILEENGNIKTLTCDDRMPWPMYSMDGRIRARGNELWTGHDRRIGHYTDDAWNFIELPIGMLTEAKSRYHNQVIDIDIAGDVIAVLTRAKLGLYNPTTHQWQISTGCPDNLNRDYGLIWDGEKLWASAGVVLYTVNLQTAACQQEVTVIEDGPENQQVGITGIDEDEMWLITYTGGNFLTGPTQQILSYRESQFIAYSVPLSTYPFPLMSVSTGMGGIPLLYFSYSTSTRDDPMFGWTSRGYRVQLSRLIGDGPEKSLAPSIQFCAEEAFEQSGWCIPQMLTTNTVVSRTKSWRGSGTLWHLYKRPRRYRW